MKTLISTLFALMLLSANSFSANEKIEIKEEEFTHIESSIKEKDFKRAQAHINLIKSKLESKHKVHRSSDTLLFLDHVKTELTKVETLIKSAKTSEALVELSKIKQYIQNDLKKLNPSNSH